MKTQVSILASIALSMTLTAAHAQSLAPKTIPVAVWDQATSVKIAGMLKLPVNLETADQKVEVTKLNYQTPNIEGKMVNASGAIAIPSWVDVTKAPIVLYHHGTKTKRTDVPSRAKNSESLIALLGLAKAGFIVFAPDYLGFGDETGDHPYLHVQTQATSSLDFLKSALQVLGRSEKDSDCKVTFAGFSQGAHASVSSHKWFEEQYKSQMLAGECSVQLLGNIAVAGPYDLSDITTLKAIANPGPSTPLYSSYLVVGMKTAYPELNLESIFQDDAREGIVKSFLDAKLTLDEIRTTFPVGIQAVYKETFLQDMINKKHPFYAALQKNNLYNWKPTAPIVFFHGQGDRDVPYDNSPLAYQTMKSNGAPVHFISFGEDVDHSGAFVRAVLSASKWKPMLQQLAQTPR